MGITFQGEQAKQRRWLSYRNRALLEVGYVILLLLLAGAGMGAVLTYLVMRHA